MAIDSSECTSWRRVPRKWQEVGEVERIRLADRGDDRGATLTLTLPPDQLEALAWRVAELLREGHDDGFLDVEGAAEFLSPLSEGRLPPR